jgi:hypothetical protein
MFSLENAKWATQQRQMNLDFNFDLMKKYMDLKKMGVSNTDIQVLMPEMSAIIIAQVGKNGVGKNGDSGDSDDSDSDSSGVTEEAV